MFKWTSIDPSVRGEFSEVGASVNIEKVMTNLLINIQNLVNDVLHMHNLLTVGNSGNDAGENNVFFS